MTTPTPRFAVNVAFDKLALVSRMSRTSMMTAAAWSLAFGGRRALGQMNTVAGERLGSTTVLELLSRFEGEVDLDASIGGGIERRHHGREPVGGEARDRHPLTRPPDQLEHDLRG